MLKYSPWTFTKRSYLDFFMLSPAGRINKHRVWKWKYPLCWVGVLLDFSILYFNSRNSNVYTLLEIKKLPWVWTIFFYQMFSCFQQVRNFLHYKWKTPLHNFSRTLECKKGKLYFMHIKFIYLNEYVIADHTMYKRLGHKSCC